MKPAWIFMFRAVGPITLICEVLNVSVSVYFERQRGRAQDRPSLPGGRHSNEALLAPICAIDAEVKSEYGWPGVWKELLARGIRVGKDRVQRLMQAHRIKARGKRKFVVNRPVFRQIVRQPARGMGYISPIRFEQNWHVGQVIKAAKPSGYGLRRSRTRSLASGSVQRAHRLHRR